MARCLFAVAGLSLVGDALARDRNTTRPSPPTAAAQNSNGPGLSDKSPGSRYPLIGPLLSASLYRNASLLVASNLTTAALGIAFWVAIARMYTPEQIGVGTGLIASAAVVASLSILGFDNSVIRLLAWSPDPVSYTHLRAHETRHDLVCRLLLEKKKKKKKNNT